MNVQVELSIAEAAIRENNRTWKHDVLLATQGDDGLVVNRGDAPPYCEVDDAVVALALDLAVWARNNNARVKFERRDGTLFFWFRRTGTFR